MKKEATLVMATPKIEKKTYKKKLGSSYDAENVVMKPKKNNITIEVKKEDACFCCC